MDCETEMVLDGRTIVEKPYIYPADDRPPITDEQTQPNGVDLRVEWIWEVTGSASLDENSKMNYSAMEKKEAEFSRHPDEYMLEPHKNYAVDFMERVSVPDGYCAIIYPRSSLLRVGAFVTSALWDTGFEGQLGGFIRPLNKLFIPIGARIAQVVFHKASFNGHRYAGRYQGTDSQSSFIT